MLTACTDLCGDANLDGTVDFEDFTVLSENFGSEGDWSQGDFNDDGRIDFPDFVILGENYGNSIGAATRITEQKVVEAASLITQGKRYSLSHILEVDSPTNPFVGHDLELDLEVRFPESANDFVGLAETVHSNFMHVGTQFDALGHIGIGDHHYNGNTYHDLHSPTGLTKLGAEDVPPFFTRGVLVDIARYKGVDILPSTYEITLEDFEGALQMQGIEIGTGDVVLFHTGWGTHYTSDPELFVQSQPGIGLEVARSLADREVVMVGADNVFVDVFPNPDPTLVLPVHQELLTKNGIYLLEIVNTEQLAKDQVYEFAFSFAPIRVAGATGSAAHPFAII
jgi:kynurenine formamidase